MLISTDNIVDKNSINNTVDFESGSVILVDKPLHWTSFDVVNKLRFKIKHGLGIRKIKVGHAGTLDPLATGLLIVCTGKKTKDIDQLQGLHKKYSGTITLGATTPTYDAEVEPTAFFPTDHITPDNIVKAKNLFIGEVDQIPPVYSAVKIKGKSAYSLARRGVDVELKPRRIEIMDFAVETSSFPVLSFECTCSKGTYIRSLAHDFGQSLNSGAYLSSLRREAIGDYDVVNALSMDEALAYIDKVTEAK